MRPRAHAAAVGNLHPRTDQAVRRTSGNDATRRLSINPSDPVASATSLAGPRACYLAYRARRTGATIAAGGGDHTVFGVRQRQARVQQGCQSAGVERGELQIGTWIKLIRNPAVLTLLKAAGLDFVRVDMEHSPPSMETIANMALLARALNFPIVVRPPKADREWITRLLDAGVWNLHCPQVESARHAAEIVAASRYAPRGRRGNEGHSPGTDYDITGTATERRAFANRQVFVVRNRGCPR
jgi:HpcH/HpaI aldolase/citrate lyase family protein